MYRIKAYRPNLRKGSYGKVKTHQWSEKPNEQGIENALEKMEYEGRFALNEEITDLTVFTDDGKISSIWVSCSKPQYKWDKGFHSFMVHYRPKKVNLLMPLAERDAEAHSYLLKFLNEAEKYFEKNELNVTVEILDRKCNEISIEELSSS